MTTRCPRCLFQLGDEGSAVSDTGEASGDDKGSPKDISEIITGSLFADLRALWRRGPELKKMTLMELLNDLDQVRLEVEKKYG